MSLRFPRNKTSYIFRTIICRLSQNNIRSIISQLIIWNRQTTSSKIIVWFVTIEGGYNPIRRWNKTIDRHFSLKRCLDLPKISRNSFTLIITDNSCWESRHWWNT